MSPLSAIMRFVAATFGILFYFCFIRKSFYLLEIGSCFFLFVLAWNIGNWIFDLVNHEKISPVGKAVLITGCDSGFGNALAKRLCDLGFFVYAGVLFPNGSGAQNLTQSYPTQLKVVKMNVTNRKDVQIVVQLIQQDSQHKLWAVVNNAGIAVSCPWMWGNDLDYYRKVFEVNIFGLIHVSKCFLPLLQRSSGRIVNMGSAAGRFTAPLGCCYTMTKHCVRVFSDSVRREAIGSQKVKVITIEPAFYRTPLTNVAQFQSSRAQLLAESPPEIISQFSGTEYEKFCARSDAIVDQITNDNPKQVVDTMVKAVMLKHPQLYYPCHGYHLFDLFHFVAQFIPEIIQDVLIYLNFKQ